MPFVTFTFRDAPDDYTRHEHSARRVSRRMLFVSALGTLYHCAPSEHAQPDGRFLTLCRKLVAPTIGTQFERRAVRLALCAECLEEYRAERSVLYDQNARAQQTIDV